MTEKKSIIQCSTDYSKFKFIEGNRALARGHLLKLKEEIELNNLLHIHPILVNNDFEIIDGQHRFTIAEMLRIPIYYIQEDISRDHIIATNTFQKSFVISDYIRYQVTEHKNPEYAKLNKFLLLTKIQVKALLCLLFGSAVANMIQIIRSGKFCFPEEQRFDDIINLYLDMRAFFESRNVRPRSMYTSYYFTTALNWLYNTTDFDRDVFMNKLADRWPKLRPAGSADNWYKLLIEIYNFRNSFPLSKEFQTNKSLDNDE